MWGQDRQRHKSDKQSIPWPRKKIASVSYLVQCTIKNALSARYNTQGTPIIDMISSYKTELCKARSNQRPKTQGLRGGAG